MSKDFFELVKAIGESKSKQEEDRIIVAEVLNLKRIVGEQGISKVRPPPSGSTARLPTLISPASC